MPTDLAPSTSQVQFALFRFHPLAAKLSRVVAFSLTHGILNRVFEGDGDTEAGICGAQADEPRSGEFSNVV
jgi:hypothetical protein